MKLFIGIRNCLLVYLVIGFIWFCWYKIKVEPYKNLKPCKIGYVSLEKVMEFNGI